MPTSMKLNPSLLLTLIFCSLLNINSAAQHALQNLIPTNAATHTAKQSGAWFSESTWEEGTIPNDAAIVVIPTDITVTYEGQSEAHIFAIRVDGTFTCKQSNANDTTKLTFDTYIGTMQSKTEFHANTVTDGHIEVQIKPFDIEAHKNGTSGYTQNWNTEALNHFSDEATVSRYNYVTGPDRRFKDYQRALAGNTTVTKTFVENVTDGVGVLGRYNWDTTQLSIGLVTMGEVEIIGQEKSVMAKLSANAERNHSEVSMETGPTGWKVGDEILITRGGNLGVAYPGTETAIIGSINGNSITTQNQLGNNHYGRTEDNLHCFVGNLDRNIRFISTNTATVTQRGHLMVMHNSTNIQIKNAAFLEMGRTNKSQLLDDLTWSHWVEPKVHQSYVSPLGQECSQMVDSPKDHITNHRGRYSIHLHQTGAANGTNLAQVTGNVVRGNPGWGITHHDAHANVSDNVVYDITGAGIVSEVGNETGFWDNNLVVDIKKGHTFDPYEANLFYGDYLYTGQGLGMKGRGVICRNNVIVEANRGVGVHNMSSAINITKRMDSEALASFRPDFMFDQFPLSKNGYSKEGDGIVPIELPLIMENTTVIWCERGLNSIERDPGVNHESRSIFDGFIAWGVANGIRINYQADYSFRDVFISGTYGNPQGVIMYKHAFNMVFERIKFADLRYAVVPSAVHLIAESPEQGRTRTPGFSPWIFIDVDTSNVGDFYYLSDIAAPAVPYTEHPDNSIILTSNQLDKTRPITFTPNDAQDLEIDLATADFEFRVDGAITDVGGTYEFGITQPAHFHDVLRIDYEERIYEFADAAALKSYLEDTDNLYKDVNDGDQLYFIINEYIPDRITYEYKPFPIRVKILNAPLGEAPYNAPKVEDAANFAPPLQLLSRSATANQSSTATYAFRDSTNIKAYASKAIDGSNNPRLNSDYYQKGLAPVGSLAITETEQEPWWEMDLGEAKIIEYIDIWNTLEMQGSAMGIPSPHFKNFYVLISDEPFGNSNLATARGIAKHEYFNPTTKRFFALNQLNITGRYIRIQAEGMNKIGIAEVDVIGRDYIATDCNGDVNGLAYLDECGVCVAGNTGKESCALDCNNEWGGTAYIDHCGTCVGGTTGLVTPIEIPCNGIDDDCNPATSDATEGQDDDGDGVCNTNDVCANGPDIGMPCDDGNPCTINDVVNAYCDCVGAIPIGTPTTNIAIGKTATQSSLKDGAGPERAIDGNTDGNMANGSVTYTNYELNPWWEIDLGANQLINQINLHNRSDCCKNRLSDFYVLLSETPFVSTSLADVLNQNSVTKLHITEMPNLTKNIPLNHSARYVRIQLNVTLFLSLAEVEILSIDNVTLYRDADGDGYGNPNESITNAACASAPAGYVFDNTDFNDNNDGCTNDNVTDKDDDGVSDCQDNCPDTPIGERVGTDGCSCSQQTLDDGDYCTTDICRDGLVNHQDMTFDETAILLQNTNPNNLLYTASQTITTDANVVIKANEDVRFYAGNSITLKSGFIVEAGAKFEAKITTECVDNEHSFEETPAVSSRNNLNFSDKNITEETKMEVAPNPFSNQTTIQIDLPRGSTTSLQIYNLNGQLMNQILEKSWLPAGVSRLTYVPQNPLSGGIYYLMLTTEEGVKSMPVVIVD